MKNLTPIFSHIINGVKVSDIFQEVKMKNTIRVLSYVVLTGIILF